MLVVLPSSSLCLILWINIALLYMIYLRMARLCKQLLLNVLFNFLRWLDWRVRTFLELEAIAVSSSLKFHKMFVVCNATVMISTPLDLRVSALFTTVSRLIGSILFVNRMRTSSLFGRSPSLSVNTCKKKCVLTEESWTASRTSSFNSFEAGALPLRSKIVWG